MDQSSEKCGFDYKVLKREAMKRFRGGELTMCQGCWDPAGSTFCQPTVRRDIGIRALIGLLRYLVLPSALLGTSKHGMFQYSSARGHWKKNCTGIKQPLFQTPRCQSMGRYGERAAQAVMHGPGWFENMETIDQTPPAAN